MKSIGNIITDSLTDGIRPSECWSSAISHSVVDSVGNKKTNHRRNTDGLIDDDARQKKKFPREHYRQNTSVCIFNGNHRQIIRQWWWHGGKCFRTLSNTDRYIPSVIVMVNTDEIFMSVIMAWVVIVWQLSVKYRRPVSVRKAVGMYLKY
jgi:hypothetical protein